jgi:hypothetical protein
MAAPERRYAGITLGGIIVIAGILLMIVWSFWIGLSSPSPAWSASEASCEGSGISGTNRSAPLAVLLVVGRRTDES